MNNPDYDNPSNLAKRRKLNGNNCYLQPIAMEPSMSPSPLCLAPLNEQEFSCDLPSLSSSNQDSFASSRSDGDNIGIQEMKEI